eukprot:CAMPEP_0116999392 /NCGR_PEP_ID=MMETSP0472-20121206/2111_1 /TAXON_ID=693140 ORGANISM="Tiarina fusus, Strain LIS" /NCGR_SAMPLE_ID=MMETSP0472 /ASSEMBLY_ACC=CAM_ASM_000603 /LENGTH=158 /DNA_ID=CAMNT_0004698793 /DNA_START=141 /DNA_END=617 /DNA_ORIENTATION=+
MGSEMESEKTTSPKQGKGVRFHSRGSIQQIRRISKATNYSEEELVAYWGESDEFRLRKQDLRTAVQEWQQGRRMSDNLEFTTIGLLDKIGEGRKEKKKNREVSRQAVLDEQELQDLEGYPDDELLSNVYQVTSAKAKDKAHEEALHIHEEVEKLSIDS